jgi:hypothetical protein
LVLAALSALGACGDVNVSANAEFPKPLVEPLPLKLGVYYSDEFAKYQHAEERWGVEWKVELGQFHVTMTDRLFASAFRDIVKLKAPADGQTSDVRAVVEPRIEQYSFITPRDTGAKYYAVTIKYRLNIFAPDGRLADSLTFTGYGSAVSSGMTSTKPMLLATRKAMRDAAAKFLVQFPEQDVVKKLVAGLPLTGTAAQSADGVVGSGGLETVPIIDPQAPIAKPGAGGSNPPGAGTPPIVPPSETKDQPPPSDRQSTQDAPPAPQPPPEHSQQTPPVTPGDEKIPDENPAPEPPVPPT